jgi:hypothetical protein
MRMCDILGDGGHCEDSSAASMGTSNGDKPTEVGRTRSCRMSLAIVRISGRFLFHTIPLHLQILSPVSPHRDTD